MVRRNYDSGDRNSIGISSEHENEADDAGTDEELLSEGRSSVEMRRIEQLGMPSGIPDELNARSQLDPKEPWSDSERRRERSRAIRGFLFLNLTLFGGIQIFPSNLHRAYEDGDTSYYLPWYLAHFIAVGLWIRLVFGARGFLPRGGADIERVYAREPPKGTAFCKECQIIKPFRSKHCYRCNRCVCKFDHHCPFLSTCIGATNRHIFWWWLLMESLAMTKCVRIVMSMDDGPSHILWLLRLVLTLEAFFYTCYVVGMLVLQSCLISFGCLQWDLAKLLRLRAFFAKRKRQERQSGGGTTSTNPTLLKLLFSDLACQNNMGLVTNWLHMCLGHVPSYTRLANPARPNLDHFLPRLKSRWEKKGRCGSAHAHGQQACNHGWRADIPKNEGEQETRRPPWMVFIRSPGEDSSPENKSQGTRQAIVEIPPDLKDVI